MLISFLIPLAIALGAGLLPLLPLLHPGLRRRLAPHAGLLALWLGYYAGYTRMLPQWWQPLPPVDSTRWLPLLLPLFALPALAGRRLWLRRSALFVLGAGSAWLTMAPLMAQGQAPLLLIPGCGLLLAALAQNDSASESTAAWLWPLLIAMIAGTSGTLFVLGSTAQMAHQAWMLALLQMPLTLMLRLGGRSLTAALADSSAYILAALWLNAGLYASPAPWQAWLLALLALPLIGRSSLARRLSPRRLALALSLTALLATGATVTAAWLLQPQDVYWG